MLVENIRGAIAIFVQQRKLIRGTIFQKMSDRMLVENIRSAIATADVAENSRVYDDGDSFRVLLDFIGG